MGDAQFTDKDPEAEGDEAKQAKQQTMRMLRYASSPDCQYGIITYMNFRGLRRRLHTSGLFALVVRSYRRIVGK